MTGNLDKNESHNSLSPQLPGERFAAGHYSPKN
jgi:hypothetical protein